MFSGTTTGATLTVPFLLERATVEPEDYLRHRAELAATSAPVPVTVLNGVADQPPGEDGSFDASVVTSYCAGSGRSLQVMEPAS